MIKIKFVPQIHTYATQHGIQNQNNIVNFFIHVLNSNVYDNIYVFVEYTGSKLEADLMNRPQELYDTYKDIREPNELIDTLGFAWFLLLFYIEEYKGKTKLNFEKSFLGSEIKLYDDIMEEILYDVNSLIQRYNLNEYINVADIAYFLGARDDKVNFIEHFKEFFQNSDPVTKQKPFFDRFYSIFNRNNRQYILDETREYLTVNYIQRVIDSKRLRQNNNAYFLVFGRLHNFENWNTFLKRNNFSFTIRRNVINENEEHLFPKYPNYNNPDQRVHSQIKQYIMNH